ncbi:MAG: helix-turn-helix domain-containing protein [Archangiaceae bacterium]|nr:helix-turn-helix domain-containing protein [Archangiaceae bacterium]
MHLGATLRLLRVEHGFGLRDLARRLGVSSAYLSRVENGLDPVPTSDRLEAIARELDLPPQLLMDAAHRLSPVAQRYLEHQPQAAALLLELAQRELGPAELAQLKRYVQAQFPQARAKAEPVEPLAERLSPRRVVLQLGGAELHDVLEVACARFTRPARGPSVRELSSALRERCEQLSPSVGAGVAVPHLSVAGVEPQAALVTLAQPLKADAADGEAISTFVVLLSPERGRAQRARIAHVARLAARGLASALLNVRQASSAIERVAALEHVR